MQDTTDGTLRASLDMSNPNTLADAFRLLALGGLLQGQLTQVRRRVNFHALGHCAYSNNVSTPLDALVLPPGGKALKLARAVDRTLGELTVEPYGTVPTTGQISISPAGDIVTLTSDSVSDCDVYYVADRCDVKEGIFPVASNALTLPAAWTTAPNGVSLLIEAESLVGTLTGLLNILTPSASAATTGACRMILNKAGIAFYSGDAVTRVRVKLAVIAAEDLCALLEGASPVL